VLACKGLIAPYPKPFDVWDVFVEYLALPAEVSDDAGCFQTSYSDAPDEEPRWTLIFGRQLTWGDQTHCVQIEYALSDGYNDSLEEADVWTTDFPDLAAFSGHVRSLPHFQLLCEDRHPTGELFVEYMS
jgi:hypothetical protein